MNDYSTAKQTGGSHQLLLDVTATTVASKGYYLTSLEDIARQMEMTKAAIYYYYASKEDLVADAILKFGQQSVARLEQIASTQGDPRDRLRQMIQEHLQIVVVEHPAVSTVFLISKEWPEQIQSTIANFKRRHDSSFRAVIDEGIDSGVFDPEHANLSRRLMHGALADCASWVTPDRLEAGLGEEIADRLLMMFTPRATT